MSVWGLPGWSQPRGEAEIRAGVLHRKGQIGTDVFLTRERDTFCLQPGREEGVGADEVSSVLDAGLLNSGLLRKHFYGLR